MLSPLEAAMVIVAGMFAGTINTIVGAGSLITFPTLLLAGLPPLVANVSSKVGIMAGGISGVVGYRFELHGQRRRVVRFGIAGTLGGLAGGLLLLALPANAFETIVPFLILTATALVAAQPRLSRWLTARRPEGHEHSWLLLAGVFATGIYGGYFGAAQGVIIIGLLAILVNDNLQRLNALKNFVVVLANGVAALLFVLVAPIDWPAAILLAAGSLVGGWLGASLARRFSPLVLRGVIVVVGLAVATRMIVG